jgi:phosphomannomutase
VIYPPVNFARDSLVGIALILHLLAETGQPVSSLVEELPAFFMTKRRLTFPLHRLVELITLLKQEYASFPVELQDGLKVSLPTGWFMVRGSNTEPVVRVVAESSSEANACAIADAVCERIRSLEEA